MNKKNLILVSKTCLLLSVLGFCIPVFDEANGFAALIYFLGAGEGALYISIGAAILLSSALRVHSFPRSSSTARITDCSNWSVYATVNSKS